MYSQMRTTKENMQKWSDVKYKDSSKTHEPHLNKNQIVHLSNYEREELEKFVARHRYIFSAQIQFRKYSGNSIKA